MIDKAVRTLFMKTQSAVLTAADGHGFYHREAERDVGHEDTIHHIEVEPVGLTLVNHGELERYLSG